MIDIPVHWLSFDPDNPASGRWDQAFLARLLAGDEGRPPHGYNFVPVDLPHKRGVTVFPCGHYAENGIVDSAVEALDMYLAMHLPAILIATSDECSTFPWTSVTLPETTRLWVMTPDPHGAYPSNARFIGEGSPTSAVEIAEIAAATRDVDVMLVGQGGHQRRDLAFNAVRSVNPKLHTKAFETGGFAQGMEVDEYLFHMTRSWITPAPSGPCTPDSFRAFEALEAGCIPILDNGYDHDADYWGLIGMGDIAPRIDFWRDLPVMVESLLVNRCETAAHISARWQQYKRQLIRQLHDDVYEWRFDIREPSGPWDQITVIIPSSPVPSNPSIEMIQHTVASVRTELPGAEILITCDGVRDEQLDRKADYDVFLHRLACWTNTQFNVWPFFFHEHLHQSGMMHAILPEVHTPFVLYVEHDTPLEGTIPFADIIETMWLCGLNSMRFLHEAAIPPGSELLFLDHGHDQYLVSPAPWRATIQWSQRPHLARTAWYRKILDANFAPDARTFIEDVMHGVVQAGTQAGRKRAREAWEQWRMAVYAPEGSWKRSGHYDGRAGDPKFPMLMMYPDGRRPDGAPPEGWSS